MDHTQPVMLNSHVQRICQVARNLPSDQQALWDLHFKQGFSKPTCCARLQLSHEQFDAMSVELMRNFRAAVTVSVESEPA